MNERSDIERVLRYWFDDGPAVMPDRVVDVVAARIAVNRQRRAWPFQRRTTVTPIKLIAGLAAALVVAVAAWQLLPGTGGTGGPPTAAPSPTVSPPPTASPSPIANFPSWYSSSGAEGAGILAPGSHTTQRFSPGFTFSVPAGWVNDVDRADTYGLFPDTPANEAEFALSGGPAQGIFMARVDSPWVICHGVGETQGATAAELVDSLVANEALTTSEPVDVAIGGLTGRRVDAQLDPDSAGICPPRPEDPPTKDYNDYRGRFIFLDTPGGGKILVIVDSVTSAHFQAFLAEAMPIIESFDFDPGQ